MQAEQVEQVAFDAVISGRRYRIDSLAELLRLINGGARFESIAALEATRVMRAEQIQRDHPRTADDRISADISELEPDAEARPLRTPNPPSSTSGGD